MISVRSHRESGAKRSANAIRCLVRCIFPQLNSYPQLLLPLFLALFLFLGATASVRCEPTRHGQHPADKTIEPTMMVPVRIISVNSVTGSVKLRTLGRKPDTLEVVSPGTVYMKDGAVIPASALAAGDRMVGVWYGPWDRTLVALCDRASYDGFYRRTVWSGAITAITPTRISVSADVYPYVKGASQIPYVRHLDRRTIFLVKGKRTTARAALAALKPGVVVYVADSGFTPQGVAIGQPIVFDQPSISVYLKTQARIGAVHFQRVRHSRV